MTYREAINKSRFKKLFGLLIGIFAFVSLLISLLKFLYFGIDDGSNLSQIVAAPIKAFVSLIYENTQFLSIFWEHSPLPNQEYLYDQNNYYFAALYILLFIGAALRSSGAKLGIRLAKTREQIEDQIIRESIDGGTKRSRNEIENSIQVPNSSIFSQFKQLYFAPVITAVIAGIILKLLFN